MRQAVGDFWTWLALASFDGMLHRSIDKTAQLSDWIVGPKPEHFGRLIVSRRLIITLALFPVVIAAILIGPDLYTHSVDPIFAMEFVLLPFLFCVASVLPLSLVVNPLRSPSPTQPAFVLALKIVGMSLLAALVIFVFAVALLIAWAGMDYELVPYWLSICRDTFYGCIFLEGYLRHVAIMASITSITVVTLLPVILVFVLFVSFVIAKVLQFMLQPLLQRVLERIYAANEGALVVIAGIFAGAKPLLEAIKRLV